MRTSTSGATSAARRANASAGSRPSPSPRPIGANVPQWIGIAILGRRRRTASAARVRIEVEPGVHARPPAPDRDEPDVEIVHEPVHLVEEVGVAGEVDARRAAQDVADRGQPQPQRRAVPVVEGGRHGHGHAAELELVAGNGLADIRESAPSCETAEPLRDHDRDVVVEQPQRGEIQVVEMPVREEDGGQIRRRLRQGGDAGQVRGALAQERIGDEPGAVHLDDERRVTQVLGRAAHTAIVRATCLTKERRARVAEATDARASSSPPRPSQPCRGCAA